MKFTRDQLVRFGNFLLSPEREVEGNSVDHADVENFIDELSKEERVQTFGEKAVGLYYNPGKSDAVAECKKIFADAIDQLDEFRNNSNEPEQKRLAAVAITQAQGAKMWAVTALTWKED